MTIAVLAGLTSVLNARRPGDKVGVLLMALLLVVFLIPWLEGAGRMRRADGLAVLRLDSPWTIFYGFLAVAGTANFVDALLRGGRAGARAGRRVSGPAVARAAADLRGAGRPPRGCSGRATGRPGGRAGFCASPATRSTAFGSGSAIAGDGLVLWIAEQFNRSAAIGDWPFRLSWTGLTPVDPESEGPIIVPDRAVVTLRGLLRRFVGPGRLDRVD